MELNIKQNCGNSPKQDLIKQLSISLASSNFSNAINFMTDNVQWVIIGKNTFVGKSYVETALHTHYPKPITTFTIHSIISHGKEAAIHGEMTVENGTILCFADFYTFSNAKGTLVQSLSSYIIPKN